MRTILTVSLLLATATVALATQSAWENQVLLIGAKLDDALAVYAKGDAATGKKLAEAAYFELFEGEARNMEVAVRMHISGKRCYELESQFTELRQGIGKGAPLAVLTTAKTKLLADLTTAANELDVAAPIAIAAPPASGINFADTFGKSLLIILREGFEVILILGAISAFLIKAGARDKLRVVTSGAVVGLVASVLTAIVSVLFVRSLSLNPEIIEGATLMLAAVVLFFVSHWLISKAESKHWVNFIQSKVNVSLSTGNMTALWLASFLAVYREGAETVLFYQGLFSMSPQQGRAIFGGLLFGAAVLAIVFITFRRGILRIPPRPFFRVTSALLYYMAFVFAGKAVVELQAGQVLRVIPLRGWPTIDFLGIYPNIQSLIVQACFVAAILGSMLFVFLRRQPEPVAA